MLEAPNVLLDGVYVQPTKIDPAKHRFLGMFRPPVNPFRGATTDCLCPCGMILRYVHQSEEHYRNGCLDTPQYRTIGDEAQSVRRCVEIVNAHTTHLYDGCDEASIAIRAEFPEAFKGSNAK